MIKLRNLRIVILSMVLAMLTVFIMSFTVSAQVAAPTHEVVLSQTSVAPATVPNSNIVLKSGKAVYSPTKLTCNSKNQPALTITNKTKKSQSVTQNGTVITTIPAGQKASFNVSGPGTAVVSLKSNSKAKLTITCS